jgi:AAA ATPase domain
MRHVCHALAGAEPPIGRAAEVGEIKKLICGAASGSGGGVLMVGESGVGKTRLVQFAVAFADAADLAVRVGQAERLEVERTLDAPLRAFDLRREQAGPSAVQRTLLSAAAHAAAGFQLADRLLEVLEAVCARGPLLVVIEDLHWADPATLVASRADHCDVTRP